MMVPMTMDTKSAFVKMPLKTFLSPWILRALISLKHCINTNTLNTIVKWSFGTFAFRAKSPSSSRGRNIGPTKQQNNHHLNFKIKLSSMRLTFENTVFKILIRLILKICLYVIPRIEQSHFRPDDRPKITIQNQLNCFNQLKYIAFISCIDSLCTKPLIHSALSIDSCTATKFMVLMAACFSSFT